MGLALEELPYISQRVRAANTNWRRKGCPHQDTLFGSHVCKQFGNCLQRIWKLFANSLENVWKQVGNSLQTVCKHCFQTWCASVTCSFCPPLLAPRLQRPRLFFFHMVLGGWLGHGTAAFKAPSVLHPASDPREMKPMLRSFPPSVK